MIPLGRLQTVGMPCYCNLVHIELPFSYFCSSDVALVVIQIRFSCHADPDPGGLP